MRRSGLTLIAMTVCLVLGTASSLDAAAQPTPQEAAFLGMAVGTGISGDPQGLTDIQGIHNAIRAERLPVT
ncbi:MAG TPA: hypothetical protein VMF68_12205, partial [Spirochaetia bacterium]|nr:hypothetical protein [Spirochaetia bacterium]